jgi:DNA mismatch repair ATPase MutS
MCAVAQREKIPLYGFFCMFAAGTQLTFALERWRAAHQEALTRWLDVWAEFEALNALAGYAYEHPAYIFPEILEGEARFEAINIGHPLLAEDRCVGNDVLLHDALRFYLISGSNMAGKSTLLRTLGVNAVLAQAGAPVRAEKARLSCFVVCASIAVSDSLLEGNSKFLAEIARLRDAIACTGSGKPVLFLIDEILSGTNSLDRKIVAESVISELVRRGAVGALSTHDLALVGIAETPELLGKNVHMESTDPLHPLDFDYRLKPGEARRSNALAIARMIGICEERLNGSGQ